MQERLTGFLIKECVCSERDFLPIPISITLYCSNPTRTEKYIALAFIRIED